MTVRSGRPVIFGEVLFDKFPDGSIVLGGAPFNVAWHLQAWGRDPLFISRVGDDGLGRNIRQAMLDWGLDTAGLQMDSDHPTGTVEVSMDGGEPVFNIVDDRAYDHIRSDSIPPAAAGLLYHGTLAVRNESSAHALYRVKQETSGPVFLDVNLRPPWWRRDTVGQLLREADQVKLNSAELSALVGSGDRKAEAMARRLLEQYDLDQIIVTLGEGGAIAVPRAGLVTAVSPTTGSGNVVDTVGAGDAFTSVAILGYILDWPLAQTMERAQLFASAIVAIRGATIREKEFYHPFIKCWGLSER